MPPCDIFARQCVSDFQGNRQRGDQARILGLDSSPNIQGLLMMLVARDGKCNHVRRIQEELIRHERDFRKDIRRDFLTNRKGPPG
jgi:hypothetical protein